LSKHTEQIKLDMLVLENQLLFAAVKLVVASCGRLNLWHFVEQVVLGCFDDVCTKRAHAPPPPFRGRASSSMPHGPPCPAPREVVSPAGDKSFILSTPLKLLKIKDSRIGYSLLHGAAQATFDMSFSSRPTIPLSFPSMMCSHAHDYRVTMM
jgi:hypothetical protein